MTLAPPRLNDTKEEKKNGLVSNERGRAIAETHAMKKVKLKKIAFTEELHAPALRRQLHAFNLVRQGLQALIEEWSAQMDAIKVCFLFWAGNADCATEMAVRKGGSGGIAAFGGCGGAECAG